MSDNISQNAMQNVAKKKRGRPRGSKNKPKPISIVKEEPISIVKEERNILDPICIEIPPERDIVESLINVAKSHQAGICVLTGSGLVYDVTIMNPITSLPNAPIKGPMYIKCFMGTYINPNVGEASPSNSSIASINPFFSIYVYSDDKEEVMGGVVEGKLMTAGNVLITAAFVKKSEVHRQDIDNETLRQVTVPIIKID